MGLFDICVSSVKCLFKLFLPLKNWIVFLILSLRVLSVLWTQILM